jgi:hypothetical protein
VSATLIERARRVAAARPNPPSEFDEARAFARQLPASAQRALEKELVARRLTKADMDAFLRQDPPRKIPRNIRYYYQFSLGLSGMGLFFLLMGTVVAVAAVLSGEWGAFVMVMIFGMIGGVMVYFGVPRFRRERRLLRHGELAVARILGVESTEVEENDQEISQVRARYEAGGQSRLVQCRAWGKPARRIAAEGRPARILYDPARPQDILLVDTLVNLRDE